MACASVWYPGQRWDDRLGWFRVPPTGDELRGIQHLTPTAQELQMMTSANSPMPAPYKAANKPGAKPQPSKLAKPPRKGR